MSQQGKVALVTGGARGIGRSFVEHLLAEGAQVSICDLMKDVGEAAVEELSKKYPQKVSFCLCDVTNDEQLEQCFQNTVKKFGGLDIVINNAGVANEWNKPFRFTVDINLNAVISGTRLGLKYMSKENGGRGGTVVNIASVTSLEPFPSVPVYSATKAAVNQYTRSMGSDLFYQKSGVKVIAINPGMTDTQLIGGAEKLFEGVPDVYKNFLEHSQRFYLQKADNLGKGLIELLQKAGNGTLWAIEHDEPPTPIDYSKEARKMY